MRAVLLPGDKQVVVTDRVRPEPGPNEVLVKTKASAICRSDMSIYNGTPIVGSARTGDDLIVPGHEAAGLVDAVGSEVTSLSIGDRVASYLAVQGQGNRYAREGWFMLDDGWRCLGFDLDGGDADYFILPEVNCLRLPDEISFPAGSVLTDMVGTQYSTQKRLGVGKDDVVVVIGLGPMGSAAILIAKAHGATVLAVDVLDARLEHARSLGADQIFNSTTVDAVESIRDATDGLGADYVIECSGSPQAQNQALDAAARLATVALVGESPKTEFNPSDQILRKLLTVIGGWYFARPEWDEITRFVLEHAIDAEKLISHTFSIEDAAEAFRAFDQRETDKAVFVW